MVHIERIVIPVSRLAKATPAPHATALLSAKRRDGIDPGGASGRDPGRHQGRQAQR